MIWSRSRIVGTRSAEARGSSRKNGLQLDRDRLGGVDERVEVVEGGAQVDRGGVEVAHEVGQLADRRRRARCAGARSRPSSRSGCRPGRRRRRGLAATRAGELRAVDDQLLEGALVAGSARRRAAREVERNGFRYLKPSFACSPTPSVECAKPLITFLKSATVSSSSVLKISSRSTSEIVSVCESVAAVLDLLARRCPRAAASAGSGGWRRRRARGSGPGRSCPRGSGA